MPSIKHILLLVGLPGLLFLRANAQSSTSPAPAPVTAQTRIISIPPEKSQPVRVPRFDQSPVIDGKLDDEVWKQSAASILISALTPDIRE